MVLISVSEARAQKTPSAIQAEISASSASGLLGGTILNDITNSFLNLVNGGNVTGNIISTPTAGTLNVAFASFQNIGGTSAALTSVNQLNLGPDTAAITGASNGLNALAVTNFFGGSTMQGNRTGIFGAVTQTAASNASNAARNYTGVQGKASSQGGDGGTNLTSDSRGSYFGGNFIASTLSLSQNLSNLVGAEFDVALVLSSTVKLAIGVSSVSFSTSHANNYEAAFSVGAATGSVGWNCGFCFTDFNVAAPIPAGGTLFGGSFPTLGVQTVTTGIDLSTGFLFTGNAFQSHLFSVANSGVVTEAGAVLTAAAPTVAAAQIGLGSTTSAAASCGSLAGAAGCLVINVAGTTRNVPFF